MMSFFVLEIAGYVVPSVVILLLHRQLKRKAI